MAVMNEASRGVRIQERARHAGTGQFEESARDAGALGEADARRGPTLTGTVAAAGLAGLPLDLVIVELDVEVAWAGIAAIDEDYLEIVQDTDIQAEAANARP